MSAFPNVSFLLCTALITVTLAVSGFAKAKDPSSTVTGILNLGLEKNCSAEAHRAHTPLGRAASSIRDARSAGHSLHRSIGYIPGSHAVLPDRYCAGACHRPHRGVQLFRFKIRRTREPLYAHPQYRVDRSRSYGFCRIVGFRPSAYLRAVQPQRRRLGLGARRRLDYPHHVGGTAQRGIG